MISIDAKKRKIQLVNIKTLGEFLVKILSTKIPGIIVFKPNSFADERGLFYESWKKNIYEEAGIKDKFLQDNISYSTRNVLRGLHYQTGSDAQGQLVTAIFGHVFDVCVDIRSESPTFGQHICFDLNKEEVAQIYMPPGIAHGFYVLSEFAILSYKCTKYYTPQSEGGLLWNDSELSIPWPIKNPIISKKDLKNISFSEYRRSILEYK